MPNNASKLYDRSVYLFMYSLSHPISKFHYLHLHCTELCYLEIVLNILRLLCDLLKFLFTIFVHFQFFCRYGCFFSHIHKVFFVSGQISCQILNFLSTKYVLVISGIVVAFKLNIFSKFFALFF